MVVIADPGLLHGVLCSNFAAAASRRRTGIRRNLAETPRMENAEKIEISELKAAVQLDRRVSVAPMMDWSD
jgi:hypothetical protein